MVRINIHRVGPLHNSHLKEKRNCQPGNAALSHRPSLSLIVTRQPWAVSVEKCLYSQARLLCGGSFMARQWCNLETIIIYLIRDCVNLFQVLCLRSRQTASGCTNRTQVQSAAFRDLKGALFSQKTKGHFSVGCLLYHGKNPVGFVFLCRDKLQSQPKGLRKIFIDFFCW